MERHRGAAIAVNLIVLAAIFLPWGGIAAFLTGYPDLAGFTSAEVCWQQPSEDGWSVDEVLEPLTDEEEGVLREALSGIDARGVQQDPRDIAYGDGSYGDMFRLTLPDGRSFFITTGMDHIIVGKGAWEASSDSLADLNATYASLCGLHRQDAELAP